MTSRASDAATNTPDHNPRPVPSLGHEASLAKSARVLAIAMLVASAANYLLNVVLARWLDLSDFGDASLMVTIMLGLTSLAVGLQLVTAKLSVEADHATRSALVRRMRRWAMGLGTLLASMFIGGASGLAAVLSTSSAVPFMVLGAGIPAYFVLAVDRGVLQGDFRFRRLASTYLVEAIVRVIVALVLVRIGFGAIGATVGLTASFLAAWAVAAQRRSRTPIPAAAVRLSEHGRSSFLPISLLLAAQVIINNGDVVLSKAILDPASAGSFAAVALVGRAVFFASWAVVQAAFPAAVEADGNDPRIARSAIGIVTAVSVTALAGIGIAAPLIGSVLFGPALQDVNLLLPYAIATSLFAIANVIATIDVAQGRCRSAAIVLGGAIAQTAAIAWLAYDAGSLVRVQVVVMALLLVSVGVSTTNLWYNGFTQKGHGVDSPEPALASAA